MTATDRTDYEQIAVEIADVVHVGWRSGGTLCRQDQAVTGREIMPVSGFYYSARDLAQELANDGIMADSLCRSCWSNSTRAALQRLEPVQDHGEQEDGNRYAGTIGEKISVMGVVQRAVPIEGAYGLSMLILIAGTGEHEGVTVKMFTAAKAAFKLHQGDTVTVIGTVKAHDLYEGARQTQVSRPKIAA